MLKCCFNLKDKGDTIHPLANSDAILSLSKNDIKISYLNKFNLLVIDCLNKFTLIKIINNFNHNYKSTLYYKRKHTKRERIKREILALKETHNVL